MTIVAGGDIGNTRMSHIMNHEVVAKQQPDLLMVGGDISYDNNVPQCYQAWDTLLRDLPIQVKDLDTEFIRIIPIIFGIGNHDIGNSAYTDNDIVYTAHEPVYKHFFPQNTNEGADPELTHRKSYFSHKFGDRLIILSLDAGYEELIQGEQSHWLRDRLQVNSTIKLAQYHSPIYPACRSERDVDVQVLGKEHWVSLFDQFNLTAALENHNHVFKRTKPIKNNTVNENGTVYLGEGSWGQLTTQCKPSNEHLVEKLEFTRAVWVFKITNKDTLKVFAVNESNQLVDSLRFN